MLSNTNLSEDAQEHVICIGAPKTNVNGYYDFNTWYNWFDENLTGIYCIVVDTSNENEKYLVSFAELRDAINFKMYFG